MGICYVSPEIFTIKGYDEKTDWWSMGVILYQCLIGNIPFNAKDPMEICQKIINYKKWIQIDELINFIVGDMNPSVIDLLSNLITNKRIRFGYQEIIKHSWFKDVSQTISDPIKPQNIGFKFDFSSESKANDLNQEIPSKPMSNEQQWTFTWNTEKESFRNSINYNKFPSSISSLELFDDYYFDTDSNEEDIENDDEKSLFSPSYCYIKCVVPDALLPAIDENDENKEQKNEHQDVDIFDHYMTVKLKSNITDKDLCRRDPLSLVICLDISGSMNATFDDKFDPYLKYKNQHKIEIAKKCLIGILDHLTEKDSFGLILFNDEPMIFQCLESINNIDVNELKTRISIYIEAAGGTNMENGYKSAISMVLQQKNENKNEEKRIMFLTDSLLNSEQLDITNINGLLGMMNKYSEINEDEGNVYSTLIGMGVDFDMDLINKMKMMRGGNCYSIHSEKEFVQTMDHGFDALINPLLFNLRLKVESTDNSCCIEKIYGVHMDDMDDILKTGEIIKMNTLFASKQNEFVSTKKGVILLKLKCNENTVNNKNLNVVKVCAIYEDKNGVTYKNEECVILETKRKQNNGIRKSILLSRYFELLCEWINHDKHYFDNTDKLKVSPIFLDKFIKFLPYFHCEMNEIKDDKLQKEVNMLEKLINAEENDIFEFRNSSPWQWNFTFDGSQQNDMQ